MKKNSKENILYITHLKNNNPNVNKLDEVLDKYNVYPLTFEESKVKFWRISEDKFELYQEVSFLSSIPNFQELNNVYDEFFRKFHIDKVFLKFFNNEIYKFTKNSQKIVPIVYANDNNIPIIYGSNSEALLNFKKDDFSVIEDKYLNRKKGVVFTALFGDYEELLDPEYVDDSLDYICFTDNDSLMSDVWKIKVIDDFNTKDNTIKARTVKMLPHKYLKDYDYSIWVDAGFKIMGDLKQFLKLYSTNKPLLTIKHSERDCIYNEGEICSKFKKDDTQIIKTQMDKYRHEKYPPHNGLVESGIMFRKHNEYQVKKVMEDWYNELIYFSKRDQLSFNYVCWKNKFEFDMIDFYCWKNPFFEHYFHQIQKIDYDDKITDLRIIILDNGDENKLNESVNAINLINNNIPVSIITSSEQIYSKKFLNNVSIHYAENYVSKINNLISEIDEDFIFIYRSGDIIKYDSIEKLMSLKNDSKDLAAIVFDDITFDEFDNEKINYKPGFSPDLYLECDYIHDSIIFNRKSLLSEGKFNENYKTFFMRDMLLKLWENNKKIIKCDSIALVIKNNFEISISEHIECMENVLKRRNCDFELNFDDDVSKPIYNPLNKKVSIIIPFKDQSDVTKTCVDSILTKTDYKNYEIILVNNNSYKEETFQFLDTLENNEKIKIIEYPFSFNYSKINNYATKYAEGEVLLFLNNDTEVIFENWLSILVGDCIQTGVGAVGAKLFYPDMKTVQHSGVGIGLTHIAGHYFMVKPDKLIPDLFNKYRRNISAVTGACLAIERSIFEEVNGFNERFDIAFSDVELCLKVLEKGYRIVYNPNVNLIHHEMKTRGKKEFRDKDRLLFYEFAKDYLENGDPYINKNISLNSSMLDKPREKDEYPYFKKFWDDFSSELKDKKQFIDDGINSLNLTNYYNFITNDDLLKNGFLMDSFLKNPYLKLDDVSWFINLPSLNDFQLNSIFEVANALSKYENTKNYFIVEDLTEDIDFMLSEIISSKFPKMIFENRSSKNNLPPVDAGICTDSETAYRLVKFNDCKCKFYFLQKDESYSKSSLNSVLINQTYDFDFIGITNNTNLYNKYSAYNKNIKHFHTTFLNGNYSDDYDKSEKMKIIFEGKPSEDLTGFEMGVNVLKVIKNLFKEEVEIYSFGEDYNNSDFNISDEITNLGKLNTEELKELYSKANISLLFMFSPEINPAVFDMMASGCVVVTNKNICLEDILLDKENCVLCEPILNCIVENISDLINETVLRDRIMKNSVQYVQKFKNKSDIIKIVNYMKNPINSYKLKKIKKPSLNKYEKLLNRNCILTESKNRLFNENYSLNQSIIDLTSENNSLKTDINSLIDENINLNQNNEKLINNNTLLKSKKHDYDIVKTRLENQMIYLNEENKRLIQEKEVMLNSKSWRLTKFLRKFKNIFLRK